MPSGLYLSLESLQFWMWLLSEVCLWAESVLSIVMLVLVVCYHCQHYFSHFSLVHSRESWVSVRSSQQRATPCHSGEPLVLSCFSQSVTRLQSTMSIFWTFPKSTLVTMKIVFSVILTHFILHTVLASQGRKSQFTLLGLSKRCCLTFWVWFWLDIDL